MGDNYLLTLGKNIKNLRLKHGWSQEELADKCGYTSDTRRSTISKIEKGQSDIPISKLKIFAKVFGVSCVDLCEKDIEGQQIKACELFEQCYGSEVYKVVQQVIKLDQEDRLVIYGEVLGMLKAEKYKKESSEDMAI